MLEPRTRFYRPSPAVTIEHGKNNETQQSSRPFNDISGEPLYVISNRHRRSMEVKTLANKAIWEDEYGNLFGSVSFKGLPCYDAELHFDQYSPSGLRVYGLKDRFCTERVDLASDIMRKAGLGTEKVVEKIPVTEVRLAGRPISVEEWKEYFLATNQIELKNSDDEIVDIPRGVIDKYIKEVEFEVTKREYQVGERLYDIMDAANTGAGKIIALGDGHLYIPVTDREITIEQFVDHRTKYVQEILDSYEADPEKKKLFTYERIIATEKERIKGDYSTSVAAMLQNPDFRGVLTSPRYLQDVLAHVFPWLNQYNKIRAQKRIDRGWNKFDEKDPRTIAIYLKSFLPLGMGNYLGGFQGIDLTIGFATPHNWSAAATLYDLDSTEGTPLGDSQPSDKRVSKDITNSIQSLYQLLSVIPLSAVEYKGQKFPHYSQFVQLFGKDIFGIIESARNNFVNSFEGSYTNSSSNKEEQIKRIAIARNFSELSQEILVDLEIDRKMGSIKDMSPLII